MGINIDVNYKITVKMFLFSFKFDENIKSKLPEMMKNLKTKLFDIPTGRINQLDEGYDQISFGWIVDFSPDNVINTAWRKEELMDFALFNEGNVYNKLFYKVRLICKTGILNACLFIILT